MPIEKLIFNVVVFFISLNVVLTISQGGIIFRLWYAFKVSNSVFSFVKNYFLSYYCKRTQISVKESYLPEVNDRMEMLISLALAGETDAGASNCLSPEDYKFSDKLRIVKPSNFISTGSTVHFNIDYSYIDSHKVLLSPTVFILAKKLFKKIEKEEEAKRLKKKEKIV